MGDNNSSKQAGKGGGGGGEQYLSCTLRISILYQIHVYRIFMGYLLQSSGIILRAQKNRVAPLPQNLINGDEALVLGPWDPVIFRLPILTSRKLFW